MNPRSVDTLIIGAGLAGLSLALALAETRQVCIAIKREATDSASQWAQGGIAMALGGSADLAAHFQDTINAGDGLCDEAVVADILSQSATVFEWLTQQGVRFTQDGSNYHLNREGGHNQRRIFHVADATGAAIQNLLITKAQSHPNILILSQHIAVDLITRRKLELAGENTCLGAYLLNKTTGQVITIAAQHTVLATGGAGKVYLYTTNPDISTGDGLAMAWRAGCRVANLEFIQFHPTCLFHPHAKSQLISEAVRGEGGLLKLPDGTRFMPQHDPRAELAPRDVVARAIDFEMKKRGLDCVYLDISHLPASFIEAHFPTILQRALTLGIDIRTTPIPVVPAAHYTCGGIMSDSAGRTDIAHLYAIGEVAHSGLHGANRLASNSLLECLVMGLGAAREILQAPQQILPTLPPWDESRVADADEEVLITHTWEELRRFMWNYVGIVRTNKRLRRAMHRITMLYEEVDEFYREFKISNDLIELRNLLQVSELIVSSALARHESRGLHSSLDYPQHLAHPQNTILQP